jgi:ATP-dependent DNA helicase RecG
MRGPGEFFGTRQAGLPGFRVANLVRDRDLLELAKQEAARFASAPEEATEASASASGIICARPGSAATA